MPSILYEILIQHENNLITTGNRECYINGQFTMVTCLAGNCLCQCSHCDSYTTLSLHELPVATVTFSALVSFLTTSGRMQSCSLDPMIATRGLWREGGREVEDTYRLVYTSWSSGDPGEGRSTIGAPVFCVFELVNDLRELGVGSGGVDDLGDVSTMS